MSTGTYRPWRPLADLPQDPFHCEGVHDDWEGFRILLRPTDLTLPMLRIAFEAMIVYRNVNESHRLRTWAELTAEIGPQPFFIVEKSAWIRWLVEESYEILRAADLVHYAIFTSEDCVEVVSAFPPVVEWVSGHHS